MTSNTTRLVVTFKTVADSKSDTAAEPGFCGAEFCCAEDCWPNAPPSMKQNKITQPDDKILAGELGKQASFLRNANSIKLQ
jgi:hypothetical protein